MIQARWLGRSCQTLKHSRRVSTLFPYSHRNFSSATSKVGSNSFTNHQQRCSPPRRNGFTPLRCASTAAASTHVADVQSDFTPPSTIPTSESEEFLSTSFDNVTSSVPAPVYEHIGFLKEMGLDFGWGTTAMMESILEHVHIYTGTPWWASIGISLLLVRAVLLKFYIDAADMTARNQLIEEYNKPIMARLTAAQAKGDSAGFAQALSETRALRAKAGVKMWKIMMPFVSVPLGFGTFRLMRGMSYLPVPGLDTGGLFWMKDLTLSDPYFILPVLTAASYYFSFKFGGEQGSTAVMNPNVKKLFLYVLPPFSGIIMCMWPGALQLTFFIQAMISLVQSAILRQPWFREMVGIQPLPTDKGANPADQVYSGTINRPSSPATPPEEKKGILGGAVADVKNAFSGAMKTATQTQKQNNSGGRRTRGEVEHAKPYDERRKREAAQERFERQQEAQARQIEAEEKYRERKEKRRH